jgi:hypothetical protein
LKGEEDRIGRLSTNQEIFVYYPRRAILPGWGKVRGQSPLQPEKNALPDLASRHPSV